MTSFEGSIGGKPKAWLRAEGLAAFGLSTGLYFAVGAPVWMYFVLILAPDLAMLGYLGGPRLGATAYNLAHTYVGPAVLAVIGVYMASAAFAIALIWCAHIGLDRLLGYGLKYPTAFGHTHLGMVGRKPSD